MENVEPNVGSTAGGLELTIKGKYFDDNSGIKAKVSLKNALIGIVWGQLTNIFLFARNKNM